MRKLYATIILMLCVFRMFAGAPLTSPARQAGFVENKGQFRDQHGNPNPDVLFIADFGGMKVHLRKDGFSYEVYQVKPKWVDPATIPYKVLTITNKGDTLESWPGMEEAYKKLMYHYQRVNVILVGSNPLVDVTPEIPEVSTDRWLIGKSDPKMVKPGRFSQVRYTGVYPGVDMICYANAETGGFKYDFVLQPGADPSLISLQYTGADQMTLTGSGDLEIVTRFGNLTESIPQCFQEDNGGRRVAVKGIHYQLAEERVSFEGVVMGEEKMVIDPAVNRVWGTYFGGVSGASSNSIRIDASKSVYVCGNTSATENIATANSYQDSLLIAEDGFFEKFSNDGTTLIYGTYLSGMQATDMDLKNGRLAITGSQGVIVFDTSGQFLWNYPFQYASSAICFDHNGNVISVGDSVLKLTESGMLAWKRDIGGTQTEISDVACDSQGNIYLVGSTEDTTGISTSGSFQPTYGGRRNIFLGPGVPPFSYDYWGISGDAFVVKLTEDGNTSWSSYYGGNNIEFGRSIAVSDSMVVFSGISNSTQSISTEGVYQTELSPNANYTFSTVGINGNSCPDPNQWYFCGSCRSGGYYPEPYDTCCQCADQFVVSFSLDGQRLWGTYVGDHNTEADGDIQFDAAGNIVVGGSSYGNGSSISTPFSYQKWNNQGVSGYVIGLNNAGQRRFGTYFPNGWDWIYMSMGGMRLNSLAVDGEHGIYGTGTSDYDAGIATPGAYQQLNSLHNSDWGSGYILKLADTEIDSITNPLHLSICTGDTLMVHANVFPDTLTTPLFQWQLDHVDISGATGATYCLPSSSSGNSGFYRCLVTDGEYKWTTDSAQVTIRDNPAFNLIKVLSANREVGNADINNDGLFEIPGDTLIYSGYADSLPSPVFFVGINHCSPRLHWFDFNNDGLPDAANDAGIYINQDGNFLLRNYSNANVWGDFNNDGAIDGFRPIQQWLCILASHGDTMVQEYAGYSNAGYSNYAEQSTITADFDHDGDNDIIRLQTNSIGQCNGNNFAGSGSICFSLIKNHNGFFNDTLMLPPIPDERNGRVAAGDFDADGDLDLLLTTIYNSYPSDSLRIRVYKNTSGQFSLFYSYSKAVNFPATYPNHAIWGDVDNDGLLDLFAGKDYFRFDGFNFQIMPTTYGLAHSGINHFDVTLADYDHDHDLDVVTAEGIYQNNICNAPNTPPSAPAALSETIILDSVAFSWQRAMDLETPQPGLSYNLRVGTTPGGYEILTSNSDSTGWRKIVGLGNVSQDTAWWLHNLKSGDYYWSVQAIDNSYEGGPFTPERHFQVWLPPEINVQPTGHTSCPGDSVLLKVEAKCYYPLSYQWYKNSIPILNEIENTLILAPLDSSDVGSYYCKISNPQLCTYSDTVEIHLFEWFVLDTAYNENKICADYNADDSLDIFQDFGFLNYCDKNLDGQVDLMTSYCWYNQDSVRFYQYVNQAWSAFCQPLPPAQKVIRQDVDNDGDTDYLLSLFETQGLERSYMKIAHSDGEGYSFTDLPYTIQSGTMDFIDIDQDQDFDLLITGWNHVLGWDGPKITRLLINTLGVFSEIPVQIPGLFYSSTDWGDYDHDGDLDLLINGTQDFNYLFNITRVYKNENGILIDAGFSLTPTMNSLVQWIDYDNDGLLDIKVGQMLYRQENNQYTLTSGVGKQGYLCDFDNDRDSDILGGNKLYRNEYCNIPPNTMPTVPANLQTTVSGDSVSFSWLPATDAQTPSPGLSYNMRVGTTPGGCQIMSPMSNPSGFRQVVELGNVQQNLGWWLHSLSPGTYYWSVQAIDNSYAGGPFAPEQSFTIAPPVPVNNAVGGDTINDGESLCFDATNTLTVGGDDNSFRVNPGGAVTLIAGQKIALLPETSVSEFGYLQAYITGNNEYCLTLNQPIVASKKTVASVEFTGLPANDAGEWSVAVYPNPVSEVLHVKIDSDLPNEPVTLVMYNLLGSRILEKTTTFSPEMKLNVSTLPPGIYLLSVEQGNQRAVVKVIRSSFHP